MGVDVFLEMHVDGLGREAACRPRALVAFIPLTTDHDHAVAEPHLGMELVGAINAAPPRDEYGCFEAEGAFEPFQRGYWILVAQRRSEGLSAGHGYALQSFSK